MRAVPPAVPGPLPAANESAHQVPPDALAEIVEAVAVRVAEIVAERPSEPALVTVDQLAADLQVEVSWVYQNRERLGGVKLGPGRGAPIRFDLAAVHRKIARGELERAARRPRRQPSQLPTGVNPIGARRTA